MKEQGREGAGANCESSFLPVLSRAGPRIGTYQEEKENQSKALARAAEDVIPLLGEVLDEAVTGGLTGTVMEEFEKAIEDTQENVRGQQLVSPEEFDAVFKVVSIGLLGIISLARAEADEEGKKLITEAAKLISPHLSLLGVQGFLALEKLERH